jgi:hypothetical protein
MNVHHATRYYDVWHFLFYENIYTFEFAIKVGKNDSLFIKILTLYDPHHTY